MLNKRGALFDLIIWLIIIFIMFVFFAGFMYGYNLLTTEVTSTVLSTSAVNVTEAGQNTFGQINSGLGALKWLALVITISMIISIMVSSFLVKAHPVFFIVYVLIIVVAIVLSVYLSNAYESILTANNPLTPTFQSFTGMNFIMLNLPIWTTIIGFMGAIFLFIGVIVDKEQGDSIPI